MIADMWLALPDAFRPQFAPAISAFNPTDMNAVVHVERMYNKYPKMWRAIGEVMCRHDDLTTLLQELETPVVNHPALKRIYQFAVDKGLPVLCHHNSDGVGRDGHDSYSYVGEVEEVLKEFPKLHFVWVHAGISRRVGKETHHDLIDGLLDKYPNLNIDISWVVWETVICEEKPQEDGKISLEPKDAWVKMIQKHSTRVTIGSDQVGQFWGNGPENPDKNLLAPEIVKYWKLFNKLTKDAAENVAYNNAFKWYFKDWDVPRTKGTGNGKEPWAYAQIPHAIPCERLNAANGEFEITGYC